MSDGATERAVWITGGSAGIGEALAQEYGRRGWRVAVSARRDRRLREVAARVDAGGGRGLAVPCDVTDEPGVREAVSTVLREFGRLDVAVANAGFVVTGRVEELNAEDWRRQLDVNVVGLAVTARHALPALRKTGGRLALVGSVAGLVPTPGTGAYGASKAAVRAIGQTLSVELAGSGVSCTTLEPGFVESEIARVDNQGVFRPEYVFTGHGKLGAFLGRHFPGLLHFAISRSRSLPGAARRGGVDSSEG